MPPADHPATRARTGARRPRRRRALFVVAAALLVAIACEAIAAVGWWAATGSVFTYPAAARLRREARDAARPDEAPAAGATAREVAARRALEGGLALHPYLGFVYKPKPQKAAGNVEPVTRYGFIDTDDPIRQRAPDRYVVAITGGSVAAQLGLYASEVLIAELSRSRTLAGRRIELVRLALGGFKQPQQLCAVQYVLALGGEFDCVIDVDGFNEVALPGENTVRGVPAYFPRGWAGLADSAMTPGQQALLGRLLFLREERARVAAAADATGWSATAQVLWLLRDRRLQTQVAAAAAALEHYVPPAQSYAATGPGTGGATLPQAIAESAAVWARCSADLHALCAAHGARYFHFLQPNQYVPGSKPIGDAERRVAVLDRHLYREGVQIGYPLLAQHFGELRQKGVAFTDLRALFHDHEEPLYSDNCCHLNRTGYEILARAIAATVRRGLDLEGAEVTGLRAEPAALHLDDPRRPLPLRVLARLADGAEVDVTDAGFGTEIRADDGEVVEVRADASLRARRRGHTQLRVRLGERELVLGVDCAWPADLAGEDGVAAPDGRVPVLRRLATETDAAGASARLQVTDCPPGLYAVLLVGSEPVPATLPVAAAVLGGRAAYPLVVGQDGSAAVCVPVPAGARFAGLPLFARALFVDAAQGRVAAASNSLVLTIE